jgi:hypothetical protein
LRLTRPGGFLSELVKSVLQRGLQAELSEHLGCRAHDPAGKGSGNSRNGSTGKPVQSEIGPIEARVPRDRAGTFTPMLLPKRARRLGGLSDMVISLYAGGMTVCDISHHLHRVYGTEVGPEGGVDLDKLVLCAGQADLQPFNLAEPCRRQVPSAPPDSSPVRDLSIRTGLGPCCEEHAGLPSTHPPTKPNQAVLDWTRPTESYFDGSTYRYSISTGVFSQVTYCRGCFVCPAGGTHSDISRLAANALVTAPTRAS